MRRKVSRDPLRADLPRNHSDEKTTSPCLRLLLKHSIIAGALIAQLSRNGSPATSVLTVGPSQNTNDVPSKIRTIVRGIKVVKLRV